jgi:hypothetical protein
VHGPCGKRAHDAGCTLIFMSASASVALPDCFQVNILGMRYESVISEARKSPGASSPLGSICLFLIGVHQFGELGLVLAPNLTHSERQLENSWSTQR